MEVMTMADEAKILELIEIARETGKIKKGANEATKAIEKGEAKLVVYAGDVSPKEVIMHLPLLCKEKNVTCIEIKSKEELGAAAGLGVGTAAVAIIREGDAKSGVEALAKEEKPAKEEKKEEAPKEEKKEKPKEEKKEEPKEKKEAKE
ncbi:50S ribosomal protein L7ae [Candidatus Woesearchaeota archaeon]|nr:50S ribosomal protein L7ae [Candidatus Woesearchaeota archaeon]